MEIADVRRRVTETIERARRTAADRRARSDEAAREYASFLEKVAVPLFRQVVNVLKAERYLFSVFTPAGSVRLASDKAGDDYIELSLETAGDEPALVVHTRRARGRRIVEAEQAIGAVGEVTEERLLAVLLRELEPFVEK